jgi:tetratricopeptide (TPR) repeat protein
MNGQSIFVSYSKEDAKEFALKLATELRNDGANVWIDQSDIAGGENYNDAVEKALGTATDVLYIVSEKSINSKQVLTEVYFALDNDKRVIPVVIYKGTLRFRLRGLQEIDFINNFENGYNKLLKTLNLFEHGGTNRFETASPLTPPKISADLPNKESIHDIHKQKTATERKKFALNLSLIILISLLLLAVSVSYFVLRKPVDFDNNSASKLSSHDTGATAKSQSDSLKTDTMSSKPANATTYFEEGKSLAESKRYVEAIKKFSTAIKLRPAYIEAFDERADAKEKIGDIESAISDYDTAINIKPDGSLYSSRGFAKSKINDYKGAIADYTKAIKLDPTDDFAYSARGWAKEDINDIKGAINDFSKSISLAPDALSYSDRANARQKLGDIKGACADLKKSCELSEYYCDDYAKLCK